jgi:hypothetical protein
MRCRECAARVAATARVCSRCGAPIVGQPPAVARTVVDAVSDAGGKALPAVAGKVLPEPFVPGSGDKLPAQLRLVLAGYVGVACGLFVGALACGAAVFLFFFTDYVFDFVDDVDPYGGDLADLILFVISIGAVLAGGACIWGLSRAVKTLKVGIRFSRLLRRPSDPHTATVMASKRGRRTLILDIPWDGTGRGYQPLSEVRLALWMQAGMLVPGERVTVYGGPGGESELLISSAQRGRVFLGTMMSRSTVQPGPVTPLDEKVSGATLIDWAAWAASTTFSSTGRGFGYDQGEVDAFRSAVRDTFLGGAVFWVSTPPVRSDDVLGKQFSTHRPGYAMKEVAAFLEAAGLRLAAMESTDRPAGPLVSGALLVTRSWASGAPGGNRSVRPGSPAEVMPTISRSRSARPASKRGLSRSGTVSGSCSITPIRTRS